MNPELADFIGSVPIHLWDEFEEKMRHDANKRFIGSRDPSKALAFFAEHDAIQRIVGMFKKESEKKQK